MWRFLPYRQASYQRLSPAESLQGPLPMAPMRGGTKAAKPRIMDARYAGVRLTGRVPMEQQSQNQGRHSADDRRGMLVGGLIVFGVGVFFLLDQLGIIPDMSDMWPIFPIIVGLALIIGSFRGSRAPRTP